MTHISQEQHKRNARLAPHMMYICPECGKGFRAQPDWRHHLNKKHDYERKTIKDFNFKEVVDNYYECQLCFKWLANAKNSIALLQYHRFMHLPYSETYRCLHCRSAFIRRRALNNHLEQQHMREIEQYEARMAATKLREQQQKLKNGKPNDLIEKALQNSHIDLNVEASGTAKNPKVEALHQSLSALEELLREDKAKEAEQVLNESISRDVDDDELEQMVEQFCDEEIEPVEATSQDKSEEIVTIEIDTLGDDEVQMFKENQTNSLSNKRRRRFIEPSSEYSEEEMRKQIEKNVLYICPQCGKENNTDESWRAHVFNTHDFSDLTTKNFRLRSEDQSYICLECNAVQTTKKHSELQRHSFLHLPYRSYLKCVFCSRTKTSSSKIFNHINYNHAAEIKEQLNKTKNDEVKRKKELRCEFCQKQFKSVGKLAFHSDKCPQKSKDATSENNINIDTAFKIIITKTMANRLRIRQILERAREKNKR